MSSAPLQQVSHQGQHVQHQIGSSVQIPCGSAMTRSLTTRRVAPSGRSRWKEQWRRAHHTSPSTTCRRVLPPAAAVCFLAAVRYHTTDGAPARVACLGLTTTSWDSLQSLSAQSSTRVRFEPHVSRHVANVPRLAPQQGFLCAGRWSRAHHSSDGRLLVSCLFLMTRLALPCTPTPPAPCARLTKLVLGSPAHAASCYELLARSDGGRPSISCQTHRCM